MAKATVYLPDELYERVRTLDIPISPTCQRALQKEVDMKSALTEDMERITLDMRDRYGERHWTVAFTGRWLVEPDDDMRTGEPGYDAGACYGVALTAKGQILVYTYHVNDGWAPGYEVYASLEEARKAGQPADILAVAADALGADFALELDI